MSDWVIDEIACTVGSVPCSDFPNGIVCVVILRRGTTLHCRAYDTVNNANRMGRRVPKDRMARGIRQTPHTTWHNDRVDDMIGV